MALTTVTSAQVPVAPQAGNEASSEYDEHVARLGAEDFAQREAAVAALTKAGLDAKTALQRGLKSTDPNVRMLCRQVIADVLELDFQRRIKDFVEDTKGERQHDIPGWEWFREEVGDSEKDRELFIRILKEEAPLLESVSGNPDRANEAITIRVQQVQQGYQRVVRGQRQMPSMETVAGLLMVASVSEEGLARDQQSLVYNLLSQSTFREAAKKGPQSNALKRLLNAWILANSDSYWTYRAVQIALEYELPHGLDLALKMLETNQANSVNAYAIVAIGKLGGKDYASALFPLLKQENVCWTWHRGNNQIVRTQVRDVALATLVYVTKQDFKEYGFDLLQKNDESVFHIYTVGFTSDEKRKAAFAKWDKWFEEHGDEFPKELPKREKIEIGKPRKAQGNQAVAQNADTNPPKADRVVSFAPADRLIRLNLDQAMRLISEQRYVEGITLLGRVLAVAENVSYQPDLSVPLHRSIKEAAQRMIAQLPPDGREVYRLQSAEAARRALDEALETGDVEALQQVLDRYFHTASGYEAAYLLGIHYRNQGEPWTAAAYLACLPENARPEYEPRSLLSRADVWQRADVWEAATAALRELPATADVRVAGQPVPVPDAETKLMDWWSKWVNPSQRGRAYAASDWLHYAGASTRNRPVRTGIPLMEATWASDVCLPFEREAMREIRKRFAENNLAPVSTSHPLVIGDLILIRTATRLVAVDIQTGTQQWYVRLDPDIETVMAEGKKNENHEQLRESLEVRLFDDLTYGTFSSDGQLVFGIEGLSFDRGDNAVTLTVQPNGSRFLDPGWTKTHNRLTAYDVTNGKLVWEVGRSALEPAAQNKADRDIFFLGAPLVMGSRLYAMAIVGGSIRLIELDGPTGDIVQVVELTEIDQNQVFDSDRQRAGLSPSYAEGVLICPISASETFALDLVSNEVLWAYRRNFMEADESVNQAIRVNMGMAGGVRMPAASRRDMRQWLDSSATIAAGKVVFAPAGTDRIYCMALRSGELLWEQPALDGLFIGGIAQGKVLLVGNTQVRALSLDSGELAWDQAVSLRHGNAPSGRGYFTNSHYYLPQADGGVLKIDIATGQALGTTHGEAVGNLVVLDDAVLSFSGDRLTRFPTTVDRRVELRQRVAAAPDDADAHAQLGAILLAEGKLREAVEHLQHAYQLQMTPENRAALVAGMLSGVRFDFNAYREWVEPLGRLAEDAEQREQYLVAVMWGSQASGDDAALLNAVRELAELDRDPELLEATAALETRRDRQVQAVIQQRYGVGAAQAMFDEAITAAASKALEDGSVAALQRFMNHFGFHPSAREVRQALVAKEAAEQSPLARELSLLDQLDNSDEAGQASATFGLLTLMLEHKRIVEAAHFAQELRGRFAQVVCDGERTGAEVLKALPSAQAELLQNLDWTAEKFEVVSDKRSPRSLSYRMPMEVAGNARPFFYPQQVFVDQAARQVVGCDIWGREQWQISLPITSSVQNAFGQPLVKARARGHLLVIARGNDVIALDTLNLNGNNARVLWQRQVKTSAEKQPNGVQIAAFRGNRNAEVFAPLFAGNTVYFQHDYQLHAVDAISGEPVWIRHDLISTSQLMGGLHSIYALSTGSGQMRVFDPLDGRDLGQRHVPDSSTHLANFDGKLLYQEHGKLVLYDLWGEQTLWEQAIDGQSKVQVFEDSVVGVLAPNGHLFVRDLLAEKTLINEQIDVPKDLQTFEMVPGREQLVIYAAASGERPNATQTSNRFGRQTSLYTGKLYAFHPATGARLWSTDVKNHVLLDVQPFAAPITTFGFQQFREVAGKKNQRAWYVNVLCIDKRNGTLLCDEEKEGMLYGTDVTADPDKQRCEVCTQQHTWAFELKK